ncbi:MAG TPA: hypothetical protein VKA83_09145 [Methylomirabilota bacterium]|nr:hypothetical protein [Methylomirabilota bacterium]
MILLFLALFVTAPLFPDGHVPGCLILTRELMQLRPCRPEELAR